MNKTWLSPILVVVPGVVALLAILYPSYLPTGRMLLLLGAWTLFVLGVAARQKRLPDWGVSAVAWVYVGLFLLPLWLDSLLRSRGMTASGSTILPKVWFFGLLGVILGAWGVYLKRSLGSAEGRRALAAALALLLLGSGLWTVGSLVFPSSRMSPSGGWMEYLRLFLAEFPVIVGIAGILLASVGLTQRWTDHRGRTALILVGGVGASLWSFWLEFDYGLVGSDYPRLMALWFTFWLTLVLPAAALLPVGRRHPLETLVIALLAAFTGVAVLQALTRVHSATLDGVLAFFHFSRSASSSTPPAVGSWARYPLTQVILSLWARYVGLAMSGLVAFLLATRGTPAPRTRPSVQARSAPSRGDLRKYFSLIGMFVVLLLLTGCAPATPIAAAAEGAHPTPTLPGVITVEGTVTDVMISARVILLETEKGPIDLALTEKTRVLGVDGRPILLREIHPGDVLRATGRPSTEKSIIPSEVRVLKAVPATPEGQEGRGEDFALVQRKDGSLWRVPLAGGEITQVLPPVEDPRWDGILWALSPDRGWLAYVTFRQWRQEGASGSLHLRSLETGEDRVVMPRLLPAGRSWKQMPQDADRAVLVENRPVWNHAGTAFLFLSGHEGRANLYLYDVQTQAVRRLASPPHNAAWPEWSPDDAWVLYHDVEAFGTGAGPTGGALWRLPATGASVPRRLTPDDEHFEAVIAWANAHTALTSYVSLTGPDHFAAVDVATGKRVHADVAHPTCLPRRGVPVRSFSRPERVMYLADPLEGCGDRWEWPEPVRVEDGLGYWGQFLNFRVEKTCYVYERGVGVKVKPMQWCGGILSPDGRYLARTQPGSVRVIDPVGGTTRVFDMGKGYVQMWWIGQGHTLWVAQNVDGKWTLYRLIPESGERQPLLDDVDVWSIRPPGGF